MKQVHIIGGGLAGSECAWQLAKRGYNVKIYEMRGVEKTAVHKTDKLAELVCSNSFRGTDESRNAVANLHRELRQLDSLIMKSADTNAVPAGGALAMDRELFADQITQTLTQMPNVEIIRGEVTELPQTDEPIIVATGPLTSSKLAAEIEKLTGKERISFFDAVAPIVDASTIDMSKAWFQSRYDKGEGTDYLNCPMTKEQYYSFINAIKEAEQAQAHNPEDAEVPYFEACLPIEVMIERGDETLRFGPLKPVGLTCPHMDEKPYAVVQLRKENKLGTMYNMVGFQTRMKWGDQKRIFATIPGLEEAEIVRFGVLHKNTFINSPELLNADLTLKGHANIRFAGQVSGVEGYVESTAMGCLAGLITAAELAGESFVLPPNTTMLGALITHITGGADAKTFQPMNVNFSLLPPMLEVHKKQRKEAYCARAQESFKAWLTENNMLIKTEEVA